MLNWQVCLSLKVKLAKLILWLQPDSSRRRSQNQEGAGLHWLQVNQMLITEETGNYVACTYSNEELEKPRKQEVTLTLPVVPFCFLWASLGWQTFVFAFFCRPHLQRIHLYTIKCCLILSAFRKKYFRKQQQQKKNLNLFWIVTVHFKYQPTSAYSHLKQSMLA